MGENSTVHDEGCSAIPGDPTQQEVTMEQRTFTQLLAKATSQLNDIIAFTNNIQQLPEAEMQQAAAAIVAKWASTEAYTLPETKTGCRRTFPISYETPQGCILRFRPQSYTET